MSHIRCKACDWSPGGQSPFNEEIVYDFKRPTKLVQDEQTRDTYCDACYDAILLTVNVNNIIDEA